MCEICHHVHCPSACPNAEETAVGVCAYCEEVIYDHEGRLCGEDGRVYHLDCLEALSPAALLEEFGIRAEVVE